MASGSLKDLRERIEVTAAMQIRAQYRVARLLNDTVVHCSRVVRLRRQLFLDGSGTHPVAIITSVGSRLPAGRLLRVTLRGKLVDESALRQILGVDAACHLLHVDRAHDHGLVELVVCVRARHDDGTRVFVDVQLPLDSALLDTSVADLGRCFSALGSCSRVDQSRRWIYHVTAGGTGLLGTDGGTRADAGAISTRSVACLLSFANRARPVLLAESRLPLFLLIRFLWSLNIIKLRCLIVEGRSGAHGFMILPSHALVDRL